MNPHDRYETVPCTICETPTMMLGTQLCDGCYGVNRGLRGFLSNAAGRLAVTEVLRDIDGSQVFHTDRILRDHNVEVVHNPGTGWIVSWDHGPATLGQLRGRGIGKEHLAAAIYVDLFLRGVHKNMAIDLAVHYVEAE